MPFSPFKPLAGLVLLFCAPSPAAAASLPEGATYGHRQLLRRGAGFRPRLPAMTAIAASLERMLKP